MKKYLLVNKNLKNSCSTGESESEVKMKSLTHVQLFATPWTVAYQAPPSMEFSRQEYWSGLPSFSWNLPNPGIKPRSPALQTDALLSKPPEKKTDTRSKIINSNKNEEVH